jgi:hypothetical protein
MGSKKKQNNNSTRIVLVVFILSGLLAAGFIWFNKGKKYLDKEAYVAVIKKNEDLKKEKTFGDMTYTCEFIPAAYNAVSRFKPEIEKSVLKKAVEESLGFVYFKLSVKSGNLENPVLNPAILSANEYGSRVRYFNAFAQENIKLLYGNDTIKCTQYIFENPYNLKADVNLMIAFKISEKTPNRDIQLIYDDQLFNNGLVKFYYDNNELQELPEIIINE